MTENVPCFPDPVSVTTDQVSNTVPDTVSNTVPDQVSNTVPDTVSQNVPDPVSQSVPDHVSPDLDSIQDTNNNNNNMSVLSTHQSDILLQDIDSILADNILSDDDLNNMSDNESNNMSDDDLNNSYDDDGIVNTRTVESSPDYVRVAETGESFDPFAKFSGNVEDDVSSHESFVEVKSS